jgi:sulfur-oxidizing protein SoxA
MSLIRAGLTVVLALGIAFSAIASPDAHRSKLINQLNHAFPDIKAEEYVHGALAFDPDSMAQYRSIMQLPPFTSELEKAERLWQGPLRSGKTYADCLPNGGRMIAGNYPLFDPVRGKVVTLETALNDCRRANGEAPYAYGDPNTMGLLSAHLRSLSDGMKMNIKVEGDAALQAWEDGKRTFYSRAGQLNYSCANCHVDNVGNRLRSEILSPAIGMAVHWPVFIGGDSLTTLQKRFERCHRDVRHTPDQAGSTRYDNLEYFLAYLSNGLPLQASVFRK